jgi:hypothetical protein
MAARERYAILCIVAAVFGVAALGVVCALVLASLGA